MATRDAPIVDAPLMSATSVSQFRSEFDAFLYASVEDRSDEMLLSVLSVLARLDVDPWQEAASLSHMTRERAAWRLAALIETLPGDSSAHMNCKATATRLIKLLPRKIAISVEAPGTTAIAGKPANIGLLLAFIILNALFMALSFGGQYFTSGHPSAMTVSHLHSLPTSKAKPAALSPHFAKEHADG